MDIHQFRSPRGCLSYMLTCEETKQSILIDPSVDMGSAYLEYLKKNASALRVVIETHTHADHVSASPKLCKQTGAKWHMHKNAPSTRKDESLEDGSKVFAGTVTLRVLFTPGHTNDGISLVLDLHDQRSAALFTGDTLLIGSCGRIDFQGGSSADLYDSIWKKLVPLGDDTIVYPAHDYKGQEKTTIGEEKMSNPRLQMSRDEFIEFMDNLNPPKPDLFDVAVSENSK